MNNRISRVKLNHWLNIRKTTLSVLNKLLKSHINFHLTLESLNQLDNHSVDKLAEVLSIPPSYILEQEKILLVQGSAFNIQDNNHFRIVFLPREDELQKAIHQIANVLEQYR